GTVLANSVLWDFGDGTTTTSVNPSHIYSSPGDYTITMVAYSGYNQTGCTDTLIMPAYIHVKEPVARFSTGDTYACAPSIVEFTDSSSDGDSYLWDFGDGSTSTNSNP